MVKRAAISIALLVKTALGADDGFELAFEEWQSAMAEPVRWEPVSIITATSSRGPIEPLQDGSLAATRPGANPARYVVKAKAALPEITALRLEIFPRAEGGHSGATILEFQAATGGPVVFGHASSDSAKKRCGPGLAIDGNPKTGWAPAPPFSEPHAAVFELKRPLATAADTVITFTLVAEAEGGLARFRISATGRRPPVRELPAPIRSALALEPTERTPAQRDALRAYFLSLRETSERPSTRR